MTTAFINRIATAVPGHDVHRLFHDFVCSGFSEDADKLALFRRMAKRSGIEHRFSFLGAGDLAFETSDDDAPFYARGAFPTTRTRMQRYEQDAPTLAQDAVAALRIGAESITHLIVTSCTGFSAPGIDLEIVERCGLSPQVERTIVGFMGCYAAIPALKLARHIVRSEPSARVLIVNIELCTLHLQDCADLDKALLFLLFSDGCAASLVSAEPAGIALDDFHSALIPDTRELMTWTVRDFGFDMVLSGQIPAALQGALRSNHDDLLGGRSASNIDLWAVHPGGRTVLDAVERAFHLPAAALSLSRETLRRYGNMSSPTVMFVLREVLRLGRSGIGCAMAFGPGLTAESMMFRIVA